jgi:hypothetical protein
MTVCDPRHVMIRGYMSASATGGRGVESPRSVPPVGSHPLLTWIRSHLSPRTEQTRKPPVAIGNAVSPRACQSRPIDVHVSRRRRTHRPRRRQANAGSIKATAPVLLAIRVGGDRTGRMLRGSAF